MATLIDIRRQCEAFNDRPNGFPARCTDLAVVQLRNRVGHACGEFCQALERERAAYDPAAFTAGLEDDTYRPLHDDDEDE